MGIKKLDYINQTSEKKYLSKSQDTSEALLQALQEASTAPWYHTTYKSNQKLKKAMSLRDFEKDLKNSFVHEAYQLDMGDFELLKDDLKSLKEVSYQERSERWEEFLNNREDSLPQTYALHNGKIPKKKLFEELYDELSGL